MRGDLLLVSFSLLCPVLSTLHSLFSKWEPASSLL